MEDPARLRIAFPCQFSGCPRAAATVEVSKRGQLFINDEQDIIYRIFPTAQGTIRVTGFLPYTNFSSQVPDLAATIAAARAVDAGALCALDHTWVPFYCTGCDRSFCADHWSLKPTFNWGFDHYSGTCPVGHPHFIDHCQLAFPTCANLVAPPMSCTVTHWPRWLPLAVCGRLAGKLRAAEDHLYRPWWT